MSLTMDELLERFQAGEATAAEISELETHLRADVGARRRLVDAFLLDAQLYKAFAGVVPVAPTRSMPIRRWRRVAAWAAAAVVLLAIGAWAAFYFWPVGGSSSHLDSGQVRVAGDASLSHIPEGKRFEVTGDVPAVFQLSDGSRAAFEPRTQGIIHGKQGGARQVVELAEGGGVFTVQAGDSKFRVDTPAGSVTALGTEFSVKLRPSAKKKVDAKSRLVLAVSVAEGSVRVEADGKEHVLAAGKSRNFGDDGDQNNRDDGDQHNKNQQKQNGNRGAQK